MEIWVIRPIRWLACAVLLLVSMAARTGAQISTAAPTGNALPDVPDAAYVLMGSASSGPTASHASISSTLGRPIAVDADGTELDPRNANDGAPQRVFADPAMDMDSKSPPATKKLRHSKRADFNRDIYYRNKLEFSLETGWLPINIPFVFDFLVGSAYTTWPLHYTMVPNIASIRWHVDGIGGPSILRGNTDFTFSGSYTAIPRGAETRYFAFDYGIRQNFVQPRWRIVPYFEARGGAGDINAKGPYGVPYAQGQDLTFTLMMGSGARYNFNPRYSIAAGLTYMHVSNAYLSQPRYEDLGINVYGTIVGVYMRIGRPKRKSGR
jgi:Lipid A 3-O-deacylase (PagL)